MGATNPGVQWVLLPPSMWKDRELAVGTWRSPSCLPSQPSAPSRMNLLISADSLAFSSTSVSISFMRLPISSEIRAAVSRSTLGTRQPSAMPPRCPHVRDKGRTSCLQGPETKPKAGQSHLNTSLLLSHLG